MAKNQFCIVLVEVTETVGYNLVDLFDIIVVAIITVITVAVVPIVLKTEAVASLIASLIQE